MLIREALNKSHMSRVAGKTERSVVSRYGQIEMIVRRTTQVVAWSTMPRRATKRALDLHATLSGRGFSGDPPCLGQAKGMTIRCVSLRESHPEKPTVTATRDLFRASLSCHIAENVSHHLDQLKNPGIPDPIIDLVGILACLENPLVPQNGKML